MAVTFTDLPKEIRNAIYEEVFFIEGPVRLILDESTTNSDTLIPWYSICAPESDTENRLFCDTRITRGSSQIAGAQSNSLLRVNREIGREACEFLYSNTRFVMGPNRQTDFDFACWGIDNILGSPGGVCILRKFVERIGAHNAANIRHFWVSLPGILPWEFLGICFELRDRFPNLRTLTLADAQFPNYGISERYAAFKVYTGVYPKGSYRSKFPIDDYFKMWEEEEPKEVSNLYSELTKMFDSLRLIH